MSNCYKCGGELPDGQVECNPVCGNADLLRDDSADLAQEAALAAELYFGEHAARLVARHLHNMGAASGKQVVEVEGRRFLVFVKLI